MAKRKRLTVPTAQKAALEPSEMPHDLETKSLANAPLGLAPARRAPIAGVAADASSTAALHKLAQQLDSARREGRMIVKLPLDQINGAYLTRDRMVLDEGEMEVLKTSLQARGQQTPIEVVQLSADYFGLISGFRRMTALRALGHETVDALIRSPQDAGAAYTAMVEENEIRVGLSYFERATITQRAVERGVFASVSQALQALFGSASRSKRSKIKSFIPLVTSLGGVLRFPAALSERQGLALVQAMEADPSFEARLKDRLRKAGPATAEDEMGLIAKALATKGAAPKGEGAKPSATKPSKTPAPIPEAPTPEAPAHIDLGTIRLTRQGHDLHLTGTGVNDDLVKALTEFLRQRG